MITATLKAICDAGPCDGGIRKLIKHLGKTVTEARKDETPLPVLTVMYSNGLDDALWVLDRAVGNERICRLFAADCAESVLHLFEAERPGDTRPRDAIAVARDPDATDEQRAAAWAAAGAAARAAARAAQEARLRQYLTHGEAAAAMPWPEKEAA
ncbi:putative immunity protein [Neotabrizicola sp. sgz301269]|uniref:putative immunity protein n=1 Tax=Neotabrizicola sp. sgz301269 TaxID=3276282 RepID=UPI0037701436